MKHTITMLFFGVVLGCTFSVCGQIVVEEDVKSTDTVNIFKSAQSESKMKKSERLAMFLNILVPGVGHQYIGDSRRAMVYLSTEAALLIGMIMSERYSTKIFADSRGYAFKYAGSQSSRDPDDEYWRVLGYDFFENVDQYNTAQENNREFDLKYLASEDSWRWEADVYQERYRKLRQDALNFHVVSSFFLGAVLLNHVVAFIDVRIMARRRTNHSRNGVKIFPYYAVSEREMGLSFVKTF